MRFNRLPRRITSKFPKANPIETPLDILKELVENSIDAQADEITLSCTEGGLKVVDNGLGIPYEDAEHVCRKFWTSKFLPPYDPTTIDTYGFRGLSLYSISMKHPINVRTKEFQARYFLGKPSHVEQDEYPYTEFQIEGVRMECSRIVENLTIYCIANPHITFKVGERKLGPFKDMDEAVDKLLGIEDMKVLSTGTLSMKLYRTKSKAGFILANRFLVDDERIRKELGENFVLILNLPKHAFRRDPSSMKKHVRFNFNVHTLVSKLTRSKTSIVRPVPLQNPTNELSSKSKLTLLKDLIIYPLNDRLLVINRTLAKRRLIEDMLDRSSYRVVRLLHPVEVALNAPSSEERMILERYGFEFARSARKFLIRGLPEFLKDVDEIALMDILLSLKGARNIQDIKEFLRKMVHYGAMYWNISDTELVSNLFLLQEPEITKDGEKVLVEMDYMELVQRFNY